MPHISPTVLVGPAPLTRHQYFEAIGCVLKLLWFFYLQIYVWSVHICLASQVFQMSCSETAKFRLYFLPLRRKAHMLCKTCMDIHDGTGQPRGFELSVRASYVWLVDTQVSHPSKLARDCSARELLAPHMARLECLSQSALRSKSVKRQDETSKHFNVSYGLRPSLTLKCFNVSSCLLTYT